MTPDPTPETDARLIADATTNAGAGTPPAPTAPAPWYRRAVAVLGLRWDGGALVLRTDLLCGYAIAIVVIAVYAPLYAGVCRKFEHFSPFPAADEQVLYYQAARNFNRFGFFASGLLQDFSTSSKPDEHPFVYTHMPPGPELFVAALFKVVGERYRLVRLVFAAIFIAGLFCWLRFASTVLRSHGLGGAMLAVFFIKPLTALRMIDHPMYCAFPLLAFLPLVALAGHYRTARRRWLWLALAAVFISSIFMAYQFVIMTLVSCVLLRVLRLARFETRHLLAFFGVAVAGVLLHVVQDVAWLGPAAAFKELQFTVTNRVSGHPTAEEMAGFYQSIDVVHHGTHTLDGGRLLLSVKESLSVPAVFQVLVLAVALLVFQLLRRARFDSATCELEVSRQRPAGEVSSWLLFRLAAWAVPTVAVPLLVFPAYSADYDLQGAGQFFVSIAAVGALACFWMHLRDLAKAVVNPTGGLWRRVFAALQVLALVGWTVGIIDIVGRRQLSYYGKCAEVAAYDGYRSLPKFAELARGKVVMTNVYPAMAGFFTHEAVLGGAEFECFPTAGPPDPDAAWAKHVRGYGPDVRPTHYVLFRAFYTGFTKNRDAASVRQLRNRIASRHRIVYEDKLFTFFELTYD